ncbi:MAG: pantoate--beta-alanine ligase [Endomicrobia bacterium]|nr:pantoate--beta-alanine ligase [Endomicrobiia bacterium]MDW8055363.1 pantoate--beta-alanine ligase [Elusimicrobiota bacterium]
MKVIKKTHQMQIISDKLRMQGKTIGFVPTMGALHQAHIELIKRARKQNDIVIVSIFVNPLQFGPKEDYNKYPRPIKQDLKICRNEKVDYVFYPPVDEMYPKDGNLTFVEVTKLEDILCGKYRSGHFRGVATVVSKLFNIVKPHNAYFGEKDYQQLKIIERMVNDLNFDVKIIPVPTVRDIDGLAYSSRNLYLSDKERSVASSLYKSLVFCKELIQQKKYTLKQCIQKSKKYLDTLLSSVEHKIQYFEIYDNDLNPVPQNLKEIPSGKRIRIFVAVFIGNTRLIDNIEVTV